MSILVFGDSITWGTADFEHGGWVTRLFIELGRDFEIDVYNLGVSGDKTPDLLERFESESKSRRRRRSNSHLCYWHQRFLFYSQ